MSEGSTDSNMRQPIDDNGEPAVEGRREIPIEIPDSDKVLQSV